ncbi:MAG: rRNA maturation RNase YbeY [Lachnospiraceae bacterium]|nr:rRNA maturation RNase YbeY [Candidatus Darwinimomas equi]
MTIYYNYEAERKMHIPWMDIISDTVNGTLEYMKYRKEAEVSVTVVDEQEIKALNNEFRGINKVTDVLSFPIGDRNPETGETVLGDIVLCAEKIISQAQEYGHTRKRELAFLTCHSMLHLLGYDHIEDEERQEMEELQRRILDKIGYTR